MQQENMSKDSGQMGAGSVSFHSQNLEKSKTVKWEEGKVGVDSQPWFSLKGRLSIREPTVWSFNCQGGCLLHFFVKPWAHGLNLVCLSDPGAWHNQWLENVLQSVC